MWILVGMFLFGVMSVSERYRLLMYNFMMLCKLISSHVLNVIYTKLIGSPSKYLIKAIYNDILSNGCFAIKLSQWMVSRFDMMYEDNEKRPLWIDEYKNLYEQCPIHSFDVTDQL